jgi:hypothetical protein
MVSLHLALGNPVSMKCLLFTFHLKNPRKSGTPVIPAPGRQKDGLFKDNLGYIASSKLAYAHSETLSQKKKNIQDRLSLFSVTLYPKPLSPEMQLASRFHSVHLQVKGKS